MDTIIKFTAKKFIENALKILLEYLNPIVFIIFIPFTLWIASKYLKMPIETKTKETNKPNVNDSDSDNCTENLIGAGSSSQDRGTKL